MDAALVDAWEHIRDRFRNLLTRHVESHWSDADQRRELPANALCFAENIPFMRHVHPLRHRSGEVPTASAILPMACPRTAGPAPASKTSCCYGDRYKIADRTIFKALSEISLDGEV